jgi:hypothetical protein
VKINRNEIGKQRIEKKDQRIENKKQIIETKMGFDKRKERSKRCARACRWRREGTRRARGWYLR